MVSKELGEQEITPLFRIDVGTEKIGKVLATGFVNEQKTVLAIMEKPRFVIVFPDMLGSFLIPILSVKEKKFIDFMPQK